MKSILNSFLIGLGTLCVVLGVIGIFLPLVPTTPFILLAAACYMRSSEKHHQRLLQHRWVGRYLRDYHEKKGIPLHAKIISIMFMCFTTSISMLFFVKIFWGRIILLLVALGVIGFLLLQKTLKPDSLYDKESEGER
jgi:uncharacterized protein